MVESIGTAAARVVSEWAWWMTALADPSQIGSKSLPIHEGHPCQGFYRAKRKNGPYEPVAIWKGDAGEWVALRNGREVDAVDIWTWCARNPVSREAYDAAVETGRWPDDDETVSAQITPPDPTIGDNSGNADENEELKDQIDAALLGVDKYAKITDDETASKALSLRNRLNELSNAAEKVRVKQKEPHLEAGKAIDKKWNPLVKGAKAGAEKVRDAIGAWETAKLAEQRKREREDEAKRIADEQARKATQGAEQSDLLSSSTVEPQEAETPPAPAQVKATYGKAASVKAVTVVDEVTDWAALSAYMLNHPEMRELLLKLAQRAVDAGRTVPGITTREEAKIR